MLKNHKIAGAISDAGWGLFMKMAQYKSEWYGKYLVKAGRFYASSKLCSNCDHKNEALALSDRQWTCSKCNATHDRDINATLNLCKEGLRILSGKGIPVEPVESPTIVGTMKQELSLLRGQFGHVSI